MEFIRKERGVLGAAQKELYGKMQALDDEISEYQNDLGNLQKDKDETQKNLDPTIQAKK
jgi:hypothetical protein